MPRRFRMGIKQIMVLHKKVKSRISHHSEVIKQLKELNEVIFSCDQIVEGASVLLGEKKSVWFYLYDSFGLEISFNIDSLLRFNEVLPVLEAIENRLNVEFIHSTDFPETYNRRYTTRYSSDRNYRIELNAILDSENAVCNRVQVDEQVRPVYQMVCA